VREHGFSFAQKPQANAAALANISLKAGDVATFSGPANIQNVLSRVTSGSRSSIDGKIRSSIAGANFFLINPAGVVFGPNASLDVSGSFAASSADYLKLADGARFVASLDADDSVLSTAPVSAFGFLGEQHAGIEVQRSTLNVPNGKTVSLVGGDISMDGGRVTSPGGGIHAASVQSAGEVPVGAVVVVGGEVVAMAHNERETKNDPTAHAEVAALRRASASLGRWRLVDAELYVTMEPCPMCAGALVNARLRRLVYGCDEPKAGAARTLYQLLDDPRLNHRVEVVPGVLADEAAGLLRAFFSRLRRVVPK
jgi:tRNA(adenine34) deaminase